MKTFSRLSLFTIICLGFAVMLIGNTAEAQQKTGLEVLGITGEDATYYVGDEVEATFFTSVIAEDDSQQPAPGITLQIIPDKVSGLPSSVVTDTLGLATVKGIVTAAGTASISASWLEKAKTDKAEFKVIGKDISPILIVVNSPSKSELKIGDTFTQTITIENRHDRFSTLPLSAWQMDVVYNPLILEVDDVVEGDFLESDGVDAFYAAAPWMENPGKISVSQARAGQMANASPPPANVASTPSPAGIALAPGDKGTLLTITFKVLAVAEEALGIHNVRLQSSQDLDELPDLDGDGVPDGVPDRISYSILVTDVAVATHQSSEPVDVNQDLDVNILDLVMVSSNIGAVPHNPRADVNGDGFVNVLDLITVYTSPHWATSVPSKQIGEANDPALTAPSISRNLDPATIKSWIDLAQVEDDGSAIFDLGIANLEALLASRIPSETRLLLNYPNPFNPETWIPYQLAEATKVTVMIHAMNGSLIRTLELGHQSAGTYKSKSQAAYWDGRNELGEQVASGLYFYTLTAGDFSATHKMLIRK